MSREVATLKNSLEQYSSLEAENESLNNEVSELKNEIRLLDDNKQTTNDSEDNPEPINTSKNINDKVSIFNLDTFKGDGGWSNATSEYYYTDTYNNVYQNAYYASHYANTKDEGSRIVTYLLDKKYSICEGQIAWSKASKNLDGSAWIEFYSGDTCIYTTDSITADSRVLSFSFSVEGIEKLTIVKSGSRSSTIAVNKAYIVYPYLNLIE